MKHIGLVLSTIFAALLLQACSSGPSVGDGNTANRAETNANSAVNSAIASASNDSPIELKTGDAFNAPDKVVTNANTVSGDYLKRPAPENSEFKSEMTNEGFPIEIRTFKNHPQLVKVERVWKPNKDKILKIYLKSGKLVEVPGNDFDDFNTASTARILVAAGVQEPPKEVLPSKKDGQ